MLCVVPFCTLAMSDLRGWATPPFPVIFNLLAIDRAVLALHGGLQARAAARAAARSVWGERFNNFPTSFRDLMACNMSHARSFGPPLGRGMMIGGVSGCRPSNACLNYKRDDTFLCLCKSPICGPTTCLFAKGEARELICVNPMIPLNWPFRCVQIQWCRVPPNQPLG